MRTLQQEALIGFITKLKRFSKYNRKWWIPLETSVYIHDLIQQEQIQNFVELGTGNGVTSAFAALAGAIVWTCDTATRPQVWNDEKFPVPHINNRIVQYDMESDKFIKANAHASDHGPELYFLDASTTANGFKRDWTALQTKVQPGDFVVTSSEHPEIFEQWQKLSKSGLPVVFSSTTKTFTLKWA